MNFAENSKPWASRICGARSHQAPEARSYDPPEKLRAALSSVNICRAVLEREIDFTVTLQASDGFDTSIIEGEPMRIKPKFGSAFGPILFSMDQVLLEALALGANQLLEWINHYPIFSFSMARVDRPNERITGVGTRQGF
jgi:hypothetical protein